MHESLFLREKNGEGEEKVVKWSVGIEASHRADTHIQTSFAFYIGVFLSLSCIESTLSQYTPIYENI